MKKTWGRKIKEAFAVVGLCFAFYYVIDVAFGLLFARKPYAAEADRLTAPAYAQEPYFSEPFLVESFTQPGGWYAPPGTRLLMPAEFHGHWFNVDPVPPTNSRFRRTENPKGVGGPGTPGVKTVLVLGPSNVYGSEVPDALTLPSQLSARLNRAGGAAYYVLNAGAQAVTAGQERERLEYELSHGLKPSDVVVYDGVNDVYVGVYRGTPGGNMGEGSERNPVKELLRKLAPLNIRRRIQDAALERVPRTTPSHLHDPAALRDLAERTAQGYLAEERRMAALARQYGFTLHVLLAPCAVFGDYQQQTPDLASTARHEAKQPLVREAFAVGFPRIQEVAKQLAAEGVDVHDLSQVLVAKTDSVFLDVWHVNSVGNGRIADAMAAAVLGRPSR